METIINYHINMEAKKTDIVKHLLRLGAFLQREGSRLLAESGLNQQQFVVLKEIQENGPISQKEICSDLLFEKSNVSKIAKKLIADKLIKMTYSDDDNRIGLLIITKKGEKIIDEYMIKLNQWNSNWLKSLSEKEIGNTIEMLSKLNYLISDLP